ncbi:MAG: metallophosphoesterase, partial [Planctomycetes bacterium]|nr:metallophosphoesterase [Planctomycetota bacterium]
MSEQTDLQVDQRPIRILHLSDFHLSTERKWDADPVLTGLVTATRQLSDDGLAPDVVAITGDIANYGKKEEYELAREWIDNQLLPALPPRFPKKRLLLVPGNHDVDRSAVKGAARAVQKALLNDRSQDAIAELLADDEEREILLKRHQAYLAFANEYRSGKQSLDVPWWSTTLKLRGSQVHFAGLCTSWMSCGAEDHGRLIVGRWQVNQLLRDAEKADVSVVLMHHPWSFLAEFDATDAESSVQRQCDLVLRGHLHRQQSRAIHTPEKACLELAAGSCYDGSEFANAFQLIEVCAQQKLVRVHYRLWHNGRWIIDRNAVHGAPDGVAEFLLSGDEPKGIVPPVDADERAAAERKPQFDPATYLSYLREQTSHIDIRGLQVGSGRATRFPIHDLYIPLTSKTAGHEPGDGDMPGHKRDELRHAGTQNVPLNECLRHRRLVIVGDPGSGKTTFLRRIANLLCLGQLGVDAHRASQALGFDEQPLPIFVRLSELVEHMEAVHGRPDAPSIRRLPEWLCHFLNATNQEACEGLDEEFFHNRLAGGQAMLLLDGLDEAPSEQHRRTLVEMIEHATLAYPKCRFVVTTRPAAYRGKVVLPDFAEVEISPLEEDAIETFLGRWSHGLFPDNPIQAEKHLHEILHALRGRPEIRRIARNPVMLTALAVVHWNEKRLPEQRADLYESIINWLSRSRDQRPGRPSPERTVGLLQNLALAMQDHPEGRRTQTAKHWAAQQLAPAFRDTPEDERVSQAEQFLAQEELDSGIIVGRGDDIRFWHLTFQEYLAAWQLSNMDFDKVTEIIQSRQRLAKWFETLQLLGSQWAKESDEKVDRYVA